MNNELNPWTLYKEEYMRKVGDTSQENGDVALLSAYALADLQDPGAIENHFNKCFETLDVNKSMMHNWNEIEVLFLDGFRKNNVINGGPVNFDRMIADLHRVIQGTNFRASFFHAVSKCHSSRVMQAVNC